MLFTRENSPTTTSRAQSKIYDVVKRLDESHPMWPAGTHICTIHGCKKPILKLKRRGDTTVWHSGKATEHVKNHHSASADPRVQNLNIIKDMKMKKVC